MLAQRLCLNATQIVYPQSLTIEPPTVLEHGESLHPTFFWRFYPFTPFRGFSAHVQVNLQVAMRCPCLTEIHVGLSTPLDPRIWETATLVPAQSFASIPVSFCVPISLENLQRGIRVFCSVIPLAAVSLCVDLFVDVRLVSSVALTSEDVSHATFFFNAYL